MSGFMFATCNEQMALRHLKLAYPNHEITEESVKEIMPYIKQDVVRIQDPEFHNPPRVVAGSKWIEDKDTREKISIEFKKFHQGLKLKTQR